MHSAKSQNTQRKGEVHGNEAQKPLAPPGQDATKGENTHTRAFTLAWHPPSHKGGFRRPHKTAPLQQPTTP